MHKALTLFDGFLRAVAAVLVTLDIVLVGYILLERWAP